jgi:hypothetical protein
VRRRIFALIGLLVMGIAAMATAANAAPRPQHRGLVVFRIHSNDPTGNVTRVDMFGLVRGRDGRDITLTDHTTSGTDRFKFRQGSVFVFHATTPGTSRDHANNTTCWFTHTEKGRYFIYDATGRYRGLRGNGKYALLVRSLAPRKSNRSCDFSDSATPRSFSLDVWAAGPATRG